MALLARYEFHRTGIGLLPGEGDDLAGTAIYVEQVPGSRRPLRSCVCAESRRRTCKHLKELSNGLRRYRNAYGKRTWDDVFAGTVWFRLAQQLQEGSPQSCEDCRVLEVSDGEQAAVRVSSDQGEELALYIDSTPARLRFLERTGKLPNGQGYAPRAGLLERLSLFQTTPQERQLAEAGMKSRRQVWEESFWHRLAYHCVREAGESKGSFHPAIDEETGKFTLTFRLADGSPFVQVTVPRNRVQAVLRMLAEFYPRQEDLAIHPIPLQSLFRVTRETELDMEVRPVIRILQQTGEERFLERRDLEKFRYGNLVYIKMLGILAELEQPDRKRKFTTPAKMRLRRGQVPGFLDRYREEIAQGTVVLDEPLKDLRIFSQHDFVEISPETLERSWYWLSVNYGFGNQSISLAQILKARQEGLPYLETAEGWVDLNAPSLRHLDSLLGRQDLKIDDKGERLRFTASQLLRLKATNAGPIRVAGGHDRSALVRRLLDLKPPRPYRQPKGLTSELRPYQQLGVDWLRFLWENRLSGLLCDDMGLGKTHQTMALMVTLKERRKSRNPFLVVCPTSVISHWRNKLRDHAPGLNAAVYHGPDRDLECYLNNNVLITSYGIMRNDIEELAQLPWDLVVFDEIQHLKNRGTLAYQAAAELGARIKLGLTGTPIENSLDDLKALFDLVLPGYLDSDEVFSERYRSAAEGNAPPTFEDPLRELRRTISPFVLRRLKETVLDELPEKIDDVRTCNLSEDQVRLYRTAIADRAPTLVDRLRTEGASLPYIHIFALLNYLKQICDHPALALRDLERAKAYTSGKWDLFREILEESLDSGQKVVIFTQYLGMVQLFEQHLRELKVGSVSLTGASRQRGQLIDRFNTDPDCRVFVGSLKAGGTGIDLVGGSVVIHYDRWWNAAREDQATDRVHRLGQKRAVQVFKLVTEGTLEEKIDAIIERKRQLMESVVEEDDPTLAKIFSREELLELLSQV